MRYNIGGFPQPGWGLTNTGPFTNLQPSTYWSGTEYAPFPNDAWLFNFGVGRQYDGAKGSDYYVWAVRPGPEAVPEPGTLFLLGTGLSGMVLLRKKMRRLHG